MTAFGNKFGNVVQGDDNMKTDGTKSIFVLTHEQIKQISKDQVITYDRIVVD